MPDDRATPGHHVRRAAARSVLDPTRAGATPELVGPGLELDLTTGTVRLLLANGPFDAGFGDVLNLGALLGDQTLDAELDAAEQSVPVTSPAQGTLR